MNGILLKALITEKSMKNAAAGRFTFAVAKDSNKTQIAQQVARSFNVKVTKVSTITVQGRTKRTGKTRQEFTSSSWKKAIVELTQGQKIDLFDVSQQEHQHA